MQTVHFKKIAVSIMLAVLVFELVGAEAPSTASSVTAYINRTTYVYARPSTSAARVRVDRGTKVEVLAVRSSWARVKRSKYTAYIQTGTCPRSHRRRRLLVPRQRHARHRAPL